MTSLAAWMDRLAAATREADRGEEAVRAEFARRLALAADERAIAYRRLNLVRILAETVADAADAPEAETRGLAWLRARFDWSSDPASPHGEIARLFAPVCQAVWEAGRAAAPSDDPPAGHAAGGERPSPPDQAAVEASPRGAARHENGRVAPEEACGAARALAAFEQAYAARTGSSFWVLFDNPMPETPRVDY